MTSFQIVLQNPWVRVALALLVFTLVILLSYLLSAVLIPLFFAFIVAYMFDPVIDVFERRKIARMTAILGLMFLLMVSLLSIPFVVVPSAVREADRLINLDTSPDEGPNWLEKVLARLPAEPLLELLDNVVDDIPEPGFTEESVTITTDDGDAPALQVAVEMSAASDAEAENPFLPNESETSADNPFVPEANETTGADAIPTESDAEIDPENIDPDVAAAEAEVQATLQNARERLADRIGLLVKTQATEFMARQTKRIATGDTSAAQPALSIFAAIRDAALGFILFIGNFALFGFVAVYLLNDYDRIVAESNKLIPERYRPKVGSVMGRIDTQLRAFLRGQAMVVFCLGVMYAIGMLLCSVPFAIPLAVFGALASFVPYLGAVLTIGPAVLLTLLAHGLDIHVVGVLAVFGLAQFLEGNILTPRIVGSQVGLGPVWVILAIMVFSSAFGFAGLLLAVPIAAALKVLVMEALDLYRESTFFKGRTLQPAGDPIPEPLPPAPRAAPRKRKTSAKKKSAAKPSPRDRKPRT